MAARRCAFLSTDGVDERFVYDALAVPALERRGFEVQTVSWHNKDVDWSDFDVVVIRSTWDYQTDSDAFLAVLETIDRSSARLLNPLEVVRWNIDKTYLLRLEERGVRIAPTIMFGGFGPVEHAMVRDLFERWHSDEVVLKPVIGANADDTFRLTPGALTREADRLTTLFTKRRFMVQPFLRRIVNEGERSLFYFNGAYSHAITKKPKAGDFRVQEDHGGLITPYQPPPALLRCAEVALAAVDTPLLYARTDFVAVDDGYALMELELIEPSLYFETDDGAGERFADALASVMDDVSPRST